MMNSSLYLDMFLLFWTLLMSLVVPAAAVFSFDRCNTSDDTLYIIVDSTLDIDMTFSRIKNFVQYFISKRDNSSETPIAVIEPFQRRVMRRTHFSSTQEIFVYLDQIKVLIGLNTNRGNNVSALFEALSFTNESLQIHKSSDGRALSNVMAWFSPCYGKCRETIRFFEKYTSDLLALQIFLYLPFSFSDSTELSHNIADDRKLYYILHLHNDTLEVNNLIAVFLCYECPSGWTEFQSGNDNSIFNCYKIYINSVKQDWIDATITCSTMDSDLPRIETDETLEFLKTFVSNAIYDTIPKIVGTFFVHTSVTKTRFGLSGLKWINRKTFMPSKAVTRKLNVPCVVVKITIHTEYETEFIGHNDKIVLELVDCEKKITQIVVCDKTKGVRDYDTSQQFFLERQPLEETRKRFSNELAFNFDSGELYSYAHTGMTLEKNMFDYKQLLFDCKDGFTTTLYNKVCNGFRDCSNGRDEFHCDLSDCSQGNDFFACINPNANGFYKVNQKILIKHKCDIMLDCPDHSDENSCDECMERRCSDGTCVPSHWLSQNGDDCMLYNHSSGTFVLNVSEAGLSIQTKQLEVIKCYQSESLNVVTMPTENAQRYTWAPKCIFLRGRSGEAIGCDDMSQLQDCANFICSEEFIKCHQSYCISLNLINDGVDDCPHGEDENRNKVYNRSGYFVCNSKNNNFIHHRQVCDGIAQCPAGDDELMCTFMCPYGFKCIGSAIMVDSISETTEMTSFRAFDIKTKFLNLSGLDLSHLNELYILPYLLELHASNCNLQSLDFLFSETFEFSIFYLDLSYNKLTQINFKEYAKNIFKNLNFLNLTGNNYLYFLNGDTINLENLQTLDISSTNISFFNLVSIKLSSSFRFLNMSNTKIESLEVLYGKEDLEFLDIRNTNLRENNTIYFLNKIIIKSALYTDNIKYCCPQVVGTGIPKHVCHAPFDGISSCEDLIGDVLKRSLVWLVAGISLIGNATVFAFRIYYDRGILKKGYRVFVVNLGIADFIMGVYLTIIFSLDIYYRDKYVLFADEWRASILCMISGFLSTLSSETSTFFILLITLDRFLVIRFPFGEHRITKSATVLSIFASWVIGFLISLIPIVYPQWTTYSSNGMCLGLPLTVDRQKGWRYAVGVFIVFNFVLFLAISIGQVLIFLSLHSQRIPDDMFNAARREQDIKVAKQLFIIVFSNFLCWFPIFVTGLCSIYGHDVSVDAYSWFVIFILPLNAALNPIIYTIPAVYKKWREIKKC